MIFDPRPLICVIGLLLAMLGITMLIPAIVDYAQGHENWAVFLNCAGATGIIGTMMFLATRGTTQKLSTRQAFVMTAAAWVNLAAFGAMPFYFEGTVGNYTDAFFESISGLTTTGATVITGLDNMPAGILLWRGMLQWLGGLGIIVMAVAVMPMLQIGGMQLFKTEAFENSEKILPRATQISGFITFIFFCITAICSIAYSIAGMNTLDAVVHAMTTVATGGFSNHDESLGYYNHLPAVDAVATLFMIIGSLPFLLYAQAIQGNWKPLLTDSQIKTFFLLLGGCIVFAVFVEYTIQQNNQTNILRLAIVNVTSILTGTGYATTAYDGWGAMGVTFFFFIMFIGGCAGSTSCGIKIFRFQVLWQNVRQHIKRILYPNGVFIPKFNGKPLGDDVLYAVMSFFFLYLLTFAISAIALCLCGVDTLTALSGAGSAISNVGPGLGNLIGPSGNYQSLGDIPKWILATTMLVGRLELFTIFVMLSPRFWKM